MLNGLPFDTARPQPQPKAKAKAKAKAKVQPKAKSAPHPSASALPVPAPSPVTAAPFRPQPQGRSQPEAQHRPPAKEASQPEYVLRPQDWHGRVLHYASHESELATTTTGPVVILVRDAEQADVAAQLVAATARHSAWILYRQAKATIRVPMLKGTQLVS